jgi:hypothetical protein
VKEEVQDIIEFLKNPGKFERLGLKMPKGILFTGPPGKKKIFFLDFFFQLEPKDAAKPTWPGQ